MNLVQALVRNWRTCGPMQREQRKWRSHERQSTEAGRRGGVIRSSVDGAVIASERRDDLIPPDSMVNQQWEEPIE